MNTNQKIKRFIENKKNIQILTEKGFVDFKGIAELGEEETFKVTFETGEFVECSINHVFFTLDERPIFVYELFNGLQVIGQNGPVTVKDIVCIGMRPLYDIMETETRTVYINGVLCHNCEFLSSNALLIDSMQIRALKEEEERECMYTLKDVKFWDKIKEGGQYIVGVDPSTGSGRDFNVIEVFEFPSMVQIAEFRSSTTASHETYRVLKGILKLLERAGGTTYFSIENNGVGEGLISLYMADENGPEFAEFVTPKGKHGLDPARMGMNTNGRNKIKACLRFKELVENKNLIIRSPTIYTELESFVKVGTRIEAEVGATDDAISATLICVRVLEHVASYDMDAYEKLYNVNDLDLEAPDDTFDGNYTDDEDPLPFIM